MDFRVLGPLQVAHDDEPIALRGSRQRALLATLLANSATPVTPHRLQRAVWADDPPANAEAALHTAVSRLRRLLERDGNITVNSTPSGYILSIPEDSVDATRFERSLGIASSPRLESATVAEILSEALALWQGEPYSDVDNDETRPQAARLQRLRTSAEQQLASALIDAARPGEAVATLEASLQRDPYCDATVLLLARSYYASGRQHDALKVLAAQRRRLADELGVDPPPALDELERAILTHDGAALPGATHLTNDEPLTSEVRFVPLRSGASAAVAALGEGPTIGMLAAWVGSVERLTDNGDIRGPLVRALAAEHRIVTYDRAGTGLSRRQIPQEHFEDTLAEAEDVLEHVADRPIPVVAFSFGSPVACALAAKRPDLISAVVSVGGYASGPETFPKREVIDSVRRMVRAHWGIGSRVMTDMFRPDEQGDLREQTAAVQREVATADVAVHYLTHTYEADVTDILPNANVPVLLIHYRDDKAVPFTGSQQLLSQLPDARLVPLRGRSHMPGPDDAHSVAETIRRFLNSLSTTDTPG